MSIDASVISNGVETHELIQKRRSGRAYDEAHPVAQADLDALLEAARWAPSGGNVQPWRYVIGRKGESDGAWDKVFALLAEGNRVWAQHAPVLILSVFEAVRTTADGRQAPNRTAMHDLGMANISLVYEAVHRGLMARMMGGFNREAALELINAEANGFDVGPVIALGYERDPAHLTEDLQARERQPRTRKPTSELLLTLE
jgi:nitroreductase